jgi:hypothetical protein
MLVSTVTLPILLNAGQVSMSASSFGPHPSVTRHPLRRLLRYSRQYRRRVWWASLCSVMNKFFDLAPQC